ncbi:MAG: DNA alkylation repair protein [Tannerellaceae bacterium]|nr:DNA alkylation repair protein [Tannerellaceae bacterium]
MTQQIIKDIRIQLRRFMNGVVSDSLRRSGVNYKLIFGVSLPRIKQIASGYTPDKQLAEQLWEQDVRELKILATMLYPPEEFTQETAEQWIKNIHHLELVEQLTLNLLRHTPYAVSLASGWLNSEEEYTAVAGFLLMSRLFAQGTLLPEETVQLFLDQAETACSGGVSRKQRVAIGALKRYGKQGAAQVKQVLEKFARYPDSGVPEQEEIYNDLKFEFEYSL